MAFQPLFRYYAQNYAHPLHLVAFHGGADRLGLRVDIPFCSGKIAVPGKVRQSVGIHVSGPTGQQVWRSVYGVNGSIFASLIAFACCFFRVDFSMWPLRGARIHRINLGIEYYEIGVLRVGSLRRA